MKFVLIILAALLGFPATCAQHKKAKHHHAKLSDRSDSRNVISGDRTGTLVSADWMRRYKQLENRHGTIPEDGIIYMEGNKYRVPSKVADHFIDMVKKRILTKCG